MAFRTLMTTVAAAALSVGTAAMAEEVTLSMLIDSSADTVASTDALTACLNRGAFTTLVDGHLERLPGMGGARQGALLVIDADHFKSINDRYGHHCGDDALRAIADAIRSSVRKGDLIRRLSELNGAKE